MSKQAVFLMCSPRGEKSASYSLGNYFSSLLDEQGISVKSFQSYKVLRKSELVEEMIKAIDESDYILLSTPLYVDQAPYMTLKLMNVITAAIKEEKIRKKRKLIIAISCAGYLEFYHNSLALKIYEQFAKENNFIWCGGFPIGAAGTYASYSIPQILEMVAALPEDDYRQFFYGKPTKVLDAVFHKAVTSLMEGKKIPSEELEKLEFVPIPLEAYANGGNKGWIEWAEQLGTTDKLRDKPYE